MSARRRGTSISATVAAFAILGLVAVAVVAVVAGVALRRITNDEALREARRLTRITAVTAIEPDLTNRVVDGDPRALARLDRAVRTRALIAPVVRVKLWTLNGTIVYSDAKALIGRHFPLSPEQLAAARHDRVAADISNATEPENVLERGYGPLLEVYLPIRTPGGQRLLYEQYLRYGAIAEDSHRLWTSLLPAVGGALIVLALAQLPLAWWLARRLERREDERDALLLQLIESSDRERRGLAQRLHEGPVQTAAGLAWRLDAAARQPERSDHAGLARMAGEAHEVVRELRGALSTLHTPSLRRAGLRAALADAAAPLRAAGTAVELDLDPGADLGPTAEALVFRVAAEGLRNAHEHARAHRVTVRLHGVDGRARLTVDDDGRGFAPDDLAGGRAEGHRGLALLQDLAVEAGGRLDVRSAPDEGTRLDLEMPAR